jgi:hypothetical protein
MKRISPANEVQCPACQHRHEHGELGAKHDGACFEVCPNCGFQHRSSETPADGFEQFVEDLKTYAQRTLNKDETYRRLPALKLISDREIRAETARLSANAPAYFWVAPATTGEYHHFRCRGTHGLWAHTLMVSQAVEDLLWTYQERGLIDESDADHARSAAILHDQRKNGPHENPAASSVSDHDLLMADVIETESELPTAVSDAVATHMGPSYDGPTPDAGTLNDLLHIADYAGSRKNWAISAPSPLPDEILALGIPEAES